MKACYEKFYIMKFHKIFLLSRLQIVIDVQKNILNKTFAQSEFTCLKTSITYFNIVLTAL